MDGKGCDCSGKLTRWNTTVNLETLINSQKRTKVSRPMMGPLDNQIVGSKSVTGIWGAEVRHLEDSTHSSNQHFYGAKIRKCHSVVRYLNN